MLLIQRCAVIIHSVSFSTEKNLDVLTEIFKGKEDAKLHIVGDGPYRQEMQEHCPTAIFPGFLKGAELSRAYASADIFIFPSTTDTFGNVVLEAMSSALPVIVTDKMGPKELVRHGENGLITTGTKDMRHKLQMLIDDEPLRKKMGAQARDYAITRSWETVFEQLFKDYRQNIIHK